MLSNANANANPNANANANVLCSTVYLSKASVDAQRKHLGLAMGIDLGPYFVQTDKQTTSKISIFSMIHLWQYFMLGDLFYEWLVPNAICTNTYSLSVVESH